VPRAERLRRWELADLAVIDEVRCAVEQDIEQAVTFAKESPYPPPEAAYTDPVRPDTGGCGMSTRTGQRSRSRSAAPAAVRRTLATMELRSPPARASVTFT
jgi:hypothetical protein